MLCLDRPVFWPSLSSGTAKAPNHPPVYPVKGQVFYEGRPAAGAVVILHRATMAAHAPRPRGRADAKGEFALTTYQTADGAPAGTAW